MTGRMMYDVETRFFMKTRDVDHTLEVADDVLNAVIDQCTMRAFGPVASTASDGSSFAIHFSVSAETETEAHETCLQVMRVIETVRDNREAEGSGSTSSVRPQDLACC